MVRLVLLAILATAFAMAPVTRVQASQAPQPAALQVVNASFESRFPETILFRLEAAIGRPIARATVHYRVAARRVVVSGNAQFTQSDGTLRAEQVFDLTRRYLPPGTPIQFHWVLQDNQGEQFRSETYQTTIEDGRYQWRQANAGNVQVSWYRGDDQFGQALLGLAMRALGQVAGDAGVTLKRTVRIMVYGDLEEFRSASYRGGLEWVGGVFYPHENVILIYAPPDQPGLDIAQRAIPHELTHAIVHQVTDNPFGDVPVWLNEGLATRSEPSFPAHHAEILAAAAAEGRLLSLQALSSAFPVDAEEVALAYAQGYSATTFLIERFGRQRLNALLQVYGEGVTYDEGLERTLGIGMAEFEREWRAWMVPWSLMKADPPSQLPPEQSEPEAADPGILQRVRELADAVLPG